MGASTHPCLTRVCYSNCIGAAIVQFFQRLSNAFVKSTNTIYRDSIATLCIFPGVVVGRRSCLLCFCLNESRTVSSGTTSGVMWLDNLFSRIRAKILPAVEKRDIHSVITTFCSVTFFVDGDYVSILSGLWCMAFLPYFDDPSVQFVGQVSSPVFPYYCWNSVSTWCFSIF